MMSEMQIHTIARQMMENHGLTAIAQAAHNGGPAWQRVPRKPEVAYRGRMVMRGPHCQFAIRSTEKQAGRMR
jgi:hypothetical protein